VKDSGQVSVAPFAHAVVSTSHEYFHLFDIFVPIALGVFAVITLVATYAVLRGRRRPVEKTARWYEHTPIESAYAVVLALIVAFLLFETFRSEHKIDTVANHQKPAVTINVVGARWEWTFEYPGYGIAIHSGTTGDSTFVVPAGQPVAFRLSSVDVIHDFWIPALHFKHDNTPGSTQLVTLEFDHTGMYSGQCAVYCGLNHAEMVFKAQAVSPARFTAWAQSGGKLAP
jgi:cytochrome c oxidase subunit II